MPENINSELLQDVLSQIYNNPKTKKFIVGKVLHIRKAFRFTDEKTSVSFQNSAARITCLFRVERDDSWAIEICSSEVGERLEASGNGVLRKSFCAFNRSPIPPVLNENQWLEIIDWCRRNAHLSDSLP